MLPMLSASIVVTGVVIFTICLWRFPAHTASLAIIVVVILDCLQMGAGGINAGISVYPDDVACIVLTACAAVVIAKGTARADVICWPALALVALGVLNFCRGAPLYGIQPAGNAVRSLMYIAVPLAVLSIASSRIRVNPALLLVWLCGLSMLFSFVALGRWAGVVPMPEYEFVDDFRNIERVLPADYPMMIGYALIGITGWQVACGVRLPFLLFTALFASIVVAVQHRSVWVATTFGLVWLFIRTGGRRSRTWSQIMSFAAATALTGALLLEVSGRSHVVVSMLTANVKEVAHQDSTFAWRLVGFAEAMERTAGSGLVNLSIGPPAGKDLSGVASAASIHIHNRYIDTFVFYGLAGGGLFVAFICILASRIHTLRASAGEDRGPAISSLVEAILFADIVYFTVYAGGLLHGCLLGMIWAVTRIHTHEGASVLAAAASRTRTSACQHVL